MKSSAWIVVCVATLAAGCSTGTAPDVRNSADAPAEHTADVASDVPAGLDAGEDNDAADIDAHLDAPADRAVDAPASDALTDASLRCLPAAPTNDLAALIAMAPTALIGGSARMMPMDHTSAPWLAARDAALAWSAADCPRFARAATTMGYAAMELTDAMGRRHWILMERTGRAFNGFFAFRAPDQLAGTRALVIDSPHWHHDFYDQRALRAYQELNAAAFLQNTADRCLLDALSGCTSFSNYACGGQVRASDVAHSIDQYYFAVFDGLESARDDFHFQYHGASAALLPDGGCPRGAAHISQASVLTLTAAEDRGYPNTFWTVLERRLGAQCVCYHQRESGCTLGGSLSVEGRRSNEDGRTSLQYCTTTARTLSGRFVHFEQRSVDVSEVIAALAETIP